MELDREPWAMWQSLRQRMEDEAGAHHFKPLAFVTHEACPHSHLLALVGNLYSTPGFSPLP